MVDVCGPWKGGRLRGLIVIVFTCCVGLSPSLEFPCTDRRMILTYCSLDLHRVIHTYGWRCCSLPFPKSVLSLLFCSGFFKAWGEHDRRKSHAPSTPCTELTEGVVNSLVALMCGCGACLAALLPGRSRGTWILKLIAVS